MVKLGFKLSPAGRFWSACPQKALPVAHNIFVSGLKF